MLGHRRFTEAARIAKERRTREDEAPRLAQVVPDLQSLVIEVRESRMYDEREVVEAEHTRRVVIPNAAALFEVRCSDRQCQDGGYDLTDEVLRELHAKHATAEGCHTCSGRVGELPCGRTMRYVLRATYGSHLT